MNKEKIDFFRKKAAKGEGRSNYIITTADTSHFYIPAVCFKALKYNEIKGKKTLFVDYPFALCPHFNPDIKKYLYWLFNKSVWRKAFKSKDIVRKGINYNITYPAQFVIQAAILARYTSEYPNIIYFWNKLQEYIDEHLALVIAHLMIKYQGGFFSFSLNISASHHGISIYYIGIEEIKKMINNTPSFKGLQSFSVSTDYTGLNKIWNNTDRIKDIVFPTPNRKQKIKIYNQETSRPCFSIRKKELKKTIATFLSLNNIEELGKQI